MLPASAMGRIIPFRKRRKVKPPRFRPGRRKRGWRESVRTCGGPGLLVGILIGTWLFVAPPKDSEWQPSSQSSFGLCGERGRPFACVTDGDTVTLGYGSSARRIRLKGFDTPEIRGACPAEVRKALEARLALQRWLNAGPFEWDGGVEPPHDRYDRELRSVRRVHPDGEVELLADTMIDAGLANADDWGLFAKDWCR